MADIFISYTSRDKEWAFWIGKELESLGHIPHLHDWELSGGGDIMAWMVERHDKADYVLGVVSDEWLRAAYSKVERMAAEWAAAKKRPGFMLYVVVRPATLPTIGDHRRRVELYGVPDVVKRQRLKDYLDSATRPVVPDASPDPVFALSNIPHRVPTHFMGRDDSLVAIDDALERYEGRVAITALHGLRGVGKTTLAAAYAERRRTDYRATWWIRAHTPDTMRADIVSLGVRLKWVAPDEKEVPAFGQVMERLRYEGDGLLLIFDNAINAASLEDFLPRGGSARVLITSNAHAWGEVAEPIDICLWSNSIGADYLIARTRRLGARSDGEELSFALGGLPLAHEQAAAYCERLDVGLAEYKRRFEAAPMRYLDDSRHAPRGYYNGRTVAKTFMLAIVEANRLNSLAEPLILHMAYFYSEPIPIFLLETLLSFIVKQSGYEIKDDDIREQLLETLAVLRSFALVQRHEILDERDSSIVFECVSLHRLVREVVIAHREPSNIEEVKRVLLNVVASVHPRSVYYSPNTWPTARRLDGLALQLVAEGALSQGMEEEAAEILNELGAYRASALANYIEARHLLARALEIRENFWGKNHVKTAISLHNIGIMYRDQKEFSKARPFLEDALKIREEKLGQYHAETAISLNQLAVLLQKQEDYAAARILLERALHVCERVLGSEHIDTACSLNNLALLMRDQGALAEALPLLERALLICEAALGPDHPNTNLVRYNLGRNELALGDGSRAFELCQAALAAHERALGPVHPWTRDSARVTADALDALGRVEEATALRGRFNLDAPRQDQS